MEIEDTKEYAGVVYGLHTGDFDFRYIGKTIQPLHTRIRKHRNTAKVGETTAVYQWMRKHGVDNVQVCVLDTFDADTIHLIDERERFHIAQARALNSENLNLTAGGDGGSGYAHTPESKAKIRDARSKQVITEETRAKMSAAHMGNKRLSGHKHSGLPTVWLTRGVDSF